ncbi:MAG: ATP synthase F0 subunit B [Acidobacteria bacterium]|nr:ATP synthase F0 subunit B [Acidobacteriota bacterium]
MKLPGLADDTTLPAAAPVLLLLNPEIPRTVNFLIFAAILIYLLRKPLSRFLAERVEAIRRDLAEAGAKKERVESRLREIEGQLARLQAEIAEFKSAAEQESLKDQERIRAATEVEMQKLKTFAGREIDGAKSAALLELKAFAARKSVEVAESLIHRELKEEDERRLVSDFGDGMKEIRR